MESAVVNGINAELKFLGGHCWKLLKPVVYKDIVVPVGFVCDLASVPRPLWWLYPPFGDYIRAAIIHDYLYEQAEVSKEEIDDVFAEVMIEDGVDNFTHFVFDKFVRWFGPPLKKPNL